MAAPVRSAALPDVPTAKEAGVPGFEAVLYYGIAAPAGTPRAIVEHMVLTQKPRLWQGVMQHRELHWERIADAPAN